MRSFTRLREKPKISLFGGEYEPARLARAHSIVAQARSFVQSAAITIEVEPLDNSSKEDEVTSKLERWLYGTQRAATDGVGNVYRDALWHYFESGQWIIRTLFDMDLALQGKFPFCIEAIDPRSFMFKKSSKGLMCAAIEERKQVDVVLHELEYYYNRATEPTWQIPDSLKGKTGSSTVEVTRYYDDTDEYLFVDKAPIWVKPHLMPRVPFDVAFCNDIPAPGDRPEESGLGLIYPIVDLLENDSKLMTKMLTPVELFFYPSMGVRTPDSYEIRQAYPGQKWNVGTDSPSPTVITPTPNYQVIQELQSRMEEDIEAATFPRAVFGPMDIQLSGYAYTQAMSGLQERLKDYAREPEAALGRHFSMLLWGVGHFSNDTVIREASLDAEQAKTYRRSFSVVMSIPTQGYKKTSTRVELREAEVEGHQIVRVSLQPNMDRDESAKYQRAAMAKTQLLLPDEFIYREILGIERPDEVMQWKRIDEIKMSNPEFAEFLMDDGLNQVLSRDKDMATRFEMWRAAKEMVTADMQPDEMMGAVPPPDGQQQIPPPTDPNQMPPELLAQLQQTGQLGNPGGMPQGPQIGMVPPGTGMPGMPPQEAMPLSPADPQQLALQRMLSGQ